MKAPAISTARGWVQRTPDAPRATPTLARAPPDPELCWSAPRRPQRSTNAVEPRSEETGAKGARTPRARRNGPAHAGNLNSISICSRKVERLDDIGSTVRNGTFLVCVKRIPSGHTCPMAARPNRWRLVTERSIWHIQQTPSPRPSHRWRGSSCWKPSYASCGKGSSVSSILQSRRPLGISTFRRALLPQRDSMPLG